MKKSHLSLRPFGATEMNLAIMAEVERHPEKLSLRYTLGGDLAAIRIPATGFRPARADGLWKTTCCECFFSPEGKPCYWELNLSPSGAWNVYRFDNYRQGMRETTEAQAPVVQTARQGELLTVAAVVPLPAAVQRLPLQVGLSAVVEGVAGNIAYWALVHPAEQPDFHDRQSFVVTV